MEKFIDRYEAGTILAEQLKEYAHIANVIVLALPRGGVPVADKVAHFLAAPLDVFIVRKLGVPGHEELAMGAIAMGGTVVFNHDVLHDIKITKAMIDDVIQKEKDELQRRELKYRGDRPFPKLTNKIIILVDDGIATGATMRAAVAALRQHKPASIVIAVPVAALSTCKAMEGIADKVVCPLKPEFFYAVGQWYQDFPQTSDEEVYELLRG